uniref:Phosphatidylinositol transfer protein membrane associated 2 n=1 Tax=Pavo cristatus TaxID=9049 RepID=A0A8C9FKH7_PAVCR
MLIKEYRIPLPMSVEEYRIAQLYMIQKKSREETCGEGSGVEILENRPYMDGPGGNGQYTHKVYHIGMHIPSWFRSILPKAALRVEEESWNAYPYTRTRYTCPFVEKFSIDIETYYKTDPGEHVNVFNLSPAEKRQTILDPIDIVKDPIPPHEYKAEEDPKLYKSVKTKRGPLSEDWIQEYRNNPGKYPIMCAYKLCKVEFRYWGMQSKIERFIHDVGDAFLQRTHNSSSSKDHVGNSLSCRSSVSHKAFLLFPASPSRHSISEWRMQSIARDSDDSSDDEFFDAHGMWNLNRLCSLPEVNFQSNFDCSHLVNCFGVISFFPCNDTKKLCSTAFILYVVLNMYHWLSCYSSFCKYNPALLLTVISELKSKGSSPPHLCCLFQVCLVGDCVGGILGFDALCYSNQTVSESQNSSRRGSVVSVQDTDLLSPGITVNNSYCSSGSNLEASRHLSRSNIDIPRSNGEDPKKQLPRKRSDSSTYELDTIKQHQAFLSSLHSSVLRNDPGSRRSSSSTMLDGGNIGKFEFEITDFFLFGSPLGLVLALRKTVIPALDIFQLRPACQQVYNLFHPADPSASRLEPLLERKFYLLPPFNIPRYQRFPLGDGNSAVLADVVQSHGAVFMESASLSTPISAPQFRGFRRASEISIASQVSGMADSYTASNIANKTKHHLNHCRGFSLLSLLALPHKSPTQTSSKRHRQHKHEVPSKGRKPKGPSSQDADCALRIPDMDIKKVAAKWWGTKRIDYALYCPDALTAFPTVALPHLFHASYWESTDVVSFLLRQVMRHENSSVLELDGKEVSVFTPSKPREKWLRKRTHVKLRNVTANHRINDTIANEDGPQTLTGRFMYGPLDMVTLTGEKVDIHIMTQPPSGEWVYFDTEISNSSGRISYVIPENRRLGIGVYPVKMVVRGDHTFADSYITVLPKGTEFVVFSIDGSFAASVSIMGSDPKVRAGAVDVVRHWQDLGYLIIYVTGRPDMQKQRVVAWLAQHNFPHGIVSFCDGLVHDPLRHKANFLKSLITDLHMRIHAAYGSTKDISVYSSISLPPTHIYIVGRPTKKLQSQCQFITEGYAAHLAQLEYNHRSRPAKNTTRMALRKGSFGLPSQTEFLRKRNHLLRTISSQPSAAGGSAGHRPERTQSQSDGDKERDRERSQRSMSIATGCWGRSAASRLESGLLGQK